MSDVFVAWTFVVKLEDIPKGKQRCVTVGAQSVIVCRVYDEVYVVRNHCPHLGKSMEGGRLQEYELICPHHNACFDIRDGKPVSGPSVWPVVTYPYRVIEGEIFISVPGDEEKSAEFSAPRLMC